METTAHTDQQRAFLTLDEVASMIGCTRQFLETRIADGEIAVFRPSSRLIRIRRTELERWIESFTHGTKVSAAVN